MIITDIDNLYYKIEKHKDLILSIKNLNRPSSSHADSYNLIKQYYNVDFPFFYCFPIAQFVFYYLGGYESNYNLKLINNIDIKCGDDYIKTTHWFVHSKDEQLIIDLTNKQFEDKNLNINKMYVLGKKAAMGFPYFKKDYKIYNKVVPNRRVMKLYQILKEKERVISKTLDFYLEEFYKSGCKF